MEINPLHNGHLYFLQEARKIAKNHTLVCIISTNFVQRGEVSVLNKEIKTKLLLENGVDIVCELPAVLANQGGTYFALNSLTILSEFNVNHLIFGSETGDLNLLQQQAESISFGDFKTGINSQLDQLKSNDILGISYLRAAKQLELDLDIHLIKRISNNYNDESIDSAIASATSIRNNLHNQQLIKNTLPVNSLANICHPNQSLLFALFKVNLENAIDNKHLIFLGEDNQLLYRMRSIISEHNPQSLEQFLHLVKDRNNSRYKYSRIVINVVLGITAMDYDPRTYIRVLGFNARSTKLLPKSSFTSLAHNDTTIAQIERRAAKLFSLLTNNFQFNEFNRKPLIYKEKNEF